MSSPRNIRNRTIASMPRLEKLDFCYFTKAGEKPKLGLTDLLDKHFRDRDVTSITEESEGLPWARWFYDLINAAFLTAEFGAQVNRVKNGLSLSERASRLRGIETDISKVLENLSGESAPELQNSAKISDAFWHYLMLAADDEFSPGDAYTALLKFRAMVQRAVLAMEIQKKQKRKNRSSRGRPRNIHKDVLFRELMEVWETATGKAPTLKIDGEGFADCAFCQFFEDYFRIDDPTAPEGFRAEAIAAYCVRLPKPAE